MFSIRLAEPTRQPSRRQRWPERLRGNLIGFAAGLTLILGIDALFLQGHLVHGVSESFALNRPGMSHAVKGAWASAVGR